MKDGWHTIEGFKVLVEDGKIHRGIINPGWNERTGYVYRKNRQLGCWASEGTISVEAFRAGVRRGTIILQ